MIGFSIIKIIFETKIVTVHLLLLFMSINILYNSLEIYCTFLKLLHRTRHNLIFPVVREIVACFLQQSTFSSEFFRTSVLGWKASPLHFLHLHKKHIKILERHNTISQRKKFNLKVTQTHLSIKEKFIKN